METLSGSLKKVDLLNKKLRSEFDLFNRAVHDGNSAIMTKAVDSIRRQWEPLYSAWVVYSRDFANRAKAGNFLVPQIKKDADIIRSYRKKISAVYQEFRGGIYTASRKPPEKKQPVSSKIATVGIALGAAMSGLTLYRALKKKKEDEKEEGQRAPAAPQPHLASDPSKDVEALYARRAQPTYYASGELASTPQGVLHFGHRPPIRLGGEHE